MADRSNEQWLADLREPGERQEAALEDLRSHIDRGLPYALSRWIPSDGAETRALVEEIAQEALLRILASLDSFEGRSRFLTWADAIAVRLAISELRRQRWKDVSLESLVEDDSRPPATALMADPAASPERLALRADTLRRVERILEEELTPRQRKALIAATVHGMPIETLAERLGSSRNTVYKLLHDARLKLRKRMLQEGLSPDSVLDLFER